MDAIKKCTASYLTKREVANAGKLRWSIQPKTAEGDASLSPNGPQDERKVNNYSSVSQGFQPKFTPKLIHSSPNSSSQADSKFQKDYKAKYKKIKAKLALLEASPSSSQNSKTFQPKKKRRFLSKSDLDLRQLISFFKLRNIIFQTQEQQARIRDGRVTVQPNISGNKILMLLVLQGKELILHEQWGNYSRQQGVCEVLNQTESESVRSDVLSEVPISDNTNNDMLNQSVQEMPYSEPSHFMEHPDRMNTLRVIGKHTEIRLKHTMEQAAILKELIQELLGHVRDTFPDIHKPSEKLVAVTPINKMKKVQFADTVTSSGNIPKATKRPILSSTGVNPSTSASGSKSLGNTNEE
ncbi:hypothetical protein Tco_0038513 [Tanacetum coccineum]